MPRAYYHVTWENSNKNDVRAKPANDNILYADEANVEIGMDIIGIKNDWILKKEVLLIRGARDSDIVTDFSILSAVFVVNLFLIQKDLKSFSIIVKINGS